MGYAGYEEAVEQSNLGERGILVRGYSPQQSQAERQAAHRRLERQLYGIYRDFILERVGSPAHDDV